MRRVCRESAALALLVAACGGSTPTIEPTATAAAMRCKVETVASYADLRTCQGRSEQVELDVAESFDGKTTATIAVASTDPDDILAAMGAFAVEWSTGADSFTVWAVGSPADAGLGYNRGVLFWNDGGPIEVTICAVEVVEDLGEICVDSTTLMLTNQ